MQLPKGWMPEDPITTAIAAAALLLALFQELRRFKERHPNVVLEARIAQASVPEGDFPNLFLTIRNRTDGSVWLSNVGISTPRWPFRLLPWKGPTFFWKSETWKKPTTLAFPYEVHSQRYVIDIVTLKQLSDYLAGRGQGGTAKFRFMVKTEAGHWYKSNLERFQMSQWRQLEGQQPTMLSDVILPRTQATVLTPVYEKKTKSNTKK